MAKAVKRAPDDGRDQSKGSIVGFLICAVLLIALGTYAYLSLAPNDWNRAFNALAIYVALGLGGIFALRENNGRTTDARLWSLAIGYGVAVVMLTTLWVAGTPITGLIWGIAFAAFAVVATVLAVSTRESAVTWQTWSVTAAVCLTFAAAATLVAPYFLTTTTQWSYALAIFVATSITFLLLFLNERIFLKRKAILQALLKHLAKSKPSVSQFDFPALNLAALRYGGNLHDGRRVQEEQVSPAHEPSASRWPLFFSAIAYLVFCALGYLLLLVPICKVFGVVETCKPAWIDPNLFWGLAHTTPDDKLIETVAIAGMAFLGAHIFTLRFLFKAALNSELNQFKWIRAALHVLTGVVVAVVLYRVLSGTDWIQKLVPGKDSNAAALWLGVAFFAGIMPDFALNTLYRFLKLKGMKLTDEDIYKSVVVVPIEVVDGIDYEIRYRLDENNIVDVQNLATYNPIALYIETPYGMGEVFDWVQQAQLCTHVGSKAYFELKAIGIRTIGQLEAQVAAGSAAYVSMVGRAMYAGATAEQLRPITKSVKTPKPIKKKPGDTTPDPAAPAPPLPEIDPACVKKAVATLCADPYIRGLRRLWEYVNAAPVSRA